MTLTTGTLIHVQGVAHILDGDVETHLDATGEGPFLEKLEKGIIVEPEQAVILPAPPEDTVVATENDNSVDTGTDSLGIEPTVDELAKLSRRELDEVAKEVGLDGNDHTNKRELAAAIVAARDS